MIMQQMKNKKSKKKMNFTLPLSPFPPNQISLPFPLPKFDWTRADDADGADDESMNHKFFTDEQLPI